MSGKMRKGVLWLKVRLTGRAQIAYQQLSDITRANYGDTKKALKERFEPASQTARYLAEFENRRKKKTEGWADFAEDLRSLVEKAYPALQEEAKAQIALSHYLRHLDQPMTSFSVKQRTPKSLDEGMEEAEIGTVASRSSSQLQDGLVHQLLQRLDKIEHELRRPERERDEKASDGQQSPRSVTCWNCGRRGACESGVLQEAKASGKLQTLRAVSQRPEGNENKAQLIARTGDSFANRGHWGWDYTTSTGRLERRLNGKLLPWYGCKLVGANGGTLNVVGMQMEYSPWATVAYTFNSKKATRSKSTEPALPVHVCLDDTIVIPPRSEVLTFATTSADVRGTWLVDEQTTKNNVAVRVARAIVHPQDSKVPVCLLNPRDVPVTMYKGMTIGEIEELRSNDVPVDNVQKANTVTKLDPKKRQMLLSLAETIGAHVSKEEQVQFSNLLLEYGDIFASSSTDLGRTGALKHCIKTGDSNPISQPVRRLPPHRKEQKKDGSVRFCIDYRKLNAVTTKDAYPLPRIDDTLDTLCGSKWFSTLDLLSGYWQVEMSPEDRHKTAFCTPQGLFEFKVMPFGLCNAPATFQRLMDLVLAASLTVLGFANYYRRFIQGFAEVAKPLHRLTEHAVNFSWTAECQEAFENLRSRLTRAPLLAFPDYTLPFVLDTDTSDLGIGAVLSQISSLGQEQVVAYGSRLLSKAERNYSVTRRELLAVVTFTRLFRPYLLEPEGQLARWLEQLQEYDFEVIHRKGRNHNNADALFKTFGGVIVLKVTTSSLKIVLAELHEGVTGGHLGQEKPLMKLKSVSTGLGHWNDVQNGFCNTCAACISRKTPAPKQRASLQSILVGQPMQLVAVDILGPLPESGNGNSYILVVGDYFTRWMEAYPSKTRRQSQLRKS
eukprot:Em0037g31a